MVKKKISKSMLLKVCRGERNFGTKTAKKIGKLTNTDPFLWMEKEKASGRKQYEKAIELSGLVEIPEKTPKTRS